METRPTTGRTGWRQASFGAAIAVASMACHEPPSSPRTIPLAEAEPPNATVGPPLGTSSSTLAPPPTAPFVPERITRDGKAMGTHVAFAAFTTERSGKGAVLAAFDAALAELHRIEALMTTWREDSEISRVNAAAGKEAVKVGSETFEVVAEAVKTSERSEGTFDITFETLHGLWKFDQDLDPHPPSDAALKKKLAHVSWKKLELGAAERTIRIVDPETRISLGGIAKGYGVDRAVAVLDKAGITSFYVQAGGDLFARGRKPDGSEWSAGVQDPRGPEKSFFALLPLSDHAFSTAGDYERSYVVGGKRYHHIIDPRTGYPATACRSVTIWAKSAFVADAIDDAVFILGPKKGLALVESLDDVGAVIVDAKNNVWTSKRLEGKLRIVAPPSDGP